MSKAFNSLQPPLVGFGKYADLTWEELVDVDSLYFGWVLLNTNRTPPSSAVLKYAKLVAGHIATAITFSHSEIKKRFEDDFPEDIPF